MCDRSGVCDRNIRQAYSAGIVAALWSVWTVPTMGFRVWIDQNLCTGDGLCVEIAPDVFQMHDDGLAYVKEASWPNLLGPDGTGPGPKYQMGEGLAVVPEKLLDDVIESAESCPGECIFLEPSDD